MDFRHPDANGPGVVVDFRRIDALGVPRTAPGQPQGRAPTLRVWRTARSPRAMVRLARAPITDDHCALGFHPHAG